MAYEMDLFIWIGVAMVLHLILPSRQTMCIDCCLYPGGGEFEPYISFQQNTRQCYIYQCLGV